ncbi:hypothetical protein Q669_07010 [Labrenzia sp. C1B10]|nr:hypothetical protein Q669_07010 [Labrenzia sp. C1B10]ERP99863.1 hypothetical protein Q675_14910 [Labrenzia sp. C1B70]
MVYTSLCPYVAHVAWFRQIQFFEKKTILIFMLIIIAISIRHEQVFLALKSY